ncbi:hypothetical protein HG531_006731 [Fusarium graminearum]|nr:hypothetical protein HG531_006731 [Fusarium graminearum]
MAPTAVSSAIDGPTTVAPSKASHSHGHELQNKTPLQAMSHGDVVLQGIPKHPDFSSQRQWQLEHLAAAFRHWHREGYVEGMSGHISVRDPEFTDAFWTNPLGRHFGLLKVSDMILVNLNGEVIGGNRTRPPNSAGFLIHASIHKARPDVHAICHSHSIHGKAWSVFGKRLEMLTQDVCKFRGDAHSVYDSYGGVVLASEEGDRIAAAMGPKGKGCILRNHGILTVGQTVDEVAWLYTSMENSCRVQLLAEAAAASGIKKVLIEDEEADFNFDVESDPEVCYCGVKFSLSNTLKIAARPTAVPKGDPCPQLDKAVHITEKNLADHQRKIRRVSQKVRNELDNLCPEHPNKQHHQVRSLHVFTLDKCVDEQDIPQNGKVEQRGPVHHECAPGVPRDENRIAEHDGVAADGSSSPSKKLIPELGPLTECGFDSCIISVLEHDKPVFLHSFSCEEVVVVWTKAVSAQQTEKELFMTETLQKIGIVEKIGAAMKLTIDGQDHSPGVVRRTRFFVATIPTWASSKGARTEGIKLAGQKT